MKKIVLGLIVLVMSFFVVISCTQEQVQNAESGNNESGISEPDNTEPKSNQLFGIWSVQTDVTLPEDWFIES